MTRGEIYRALWRQRSSGFRAGLQAPSSLGLTRTQPRLFYSSGRATAKPPSSHVQTRRDRSKFPTATTIRQLSR